MSNRRRPERRDAHGAPVRSRHEIMVAGAVVVGVLALTVVGGEQRDQHDDHGRDPREQRGDVEPVDRHQLHDRGIEHDRGDGQHHEAVTASRSAFEAGLGVELDPFQQRAFDALDAGSSVLVAAPTGAGKTLVAEYAIHRALAEGGKVLYAIADRASGDITVLPTFVRTPGGELAPNPEAARYDARGHERGGRGRPRSRLTAPRRSELVARLRDDSMLPVITFIFSRNACDDAVQQCLAAGLRLTDADERRALRRIADARSAPLTDDDLDALGYDEWLSGFENGIAAHHAGLVPPLKEAVEEAFAAGLVKAVFATETLSLGINMPARTVVIEKLSKFTGEHHEFLTPGEYTQLTGRAGRRGIDPVGYAVVCWNRFVPFDQVAGLASRRTSALTSSFRPNYNMATNLVARYAPDPAPPLHNLWFAQYGGARAVVSIERHIPHND